MSFTKEQLAAMVRDAETMCAQPSSDYLADVRCHVRALVAEVERLTAILHVITDGSGRCGWLSENTAVNVHLWNLPHCDGPQGTLLEAAEAARKKKP
jgi:hypothetical protein